MSLNPLRVARWLVNDLSRTLWAVVGVWVICSMAYWLLERDLEGGPTGPISGLWWGIVTASTVGYGDYSPQTTAGRFFGGVLIVAMWCLVIAAGSHFTKALLDDPDAWTDGEQQQLLTDVAETRAQVEAIRALLLTHHAISVGMAAADKPPVQSIARDEHGPLVDLHADGSGRIAQHRSPAVPPGTAVIGAFGLGANIYEPVNTRRTRLMARIKNLFRGRR